MIALSAVLPHVLPMPWSELEPWHGMRAFRSIFGVCVLGSVEDRGPETGIWLHVSLSRMERLPNWREVREVKDLFIGRDRCAIHMLPPEAHYVNLHQFTFHLFTRLDGDTVPPRLYEDQ